MATVAAPHCAVVRGNTRFFNIMAFVMAFVIVAGFSLNLAMGRSTFAAPLAYHVHAMIFMGWVALYLAQNVTAARGNWALHRSLGKLAYLWVPAMVAAGCMIMIIVARRTGGPFFFNVSEFLISNLVGILTFGGLALWALRRQRHTGWHRRLMLVAMSILTGPGIGRLLPMPLLIPNAWTISFCVTLVFPIVGMIADKRKLGHVHPAYWWGTGIVIGTFVLSMLLAFSPPGYAITEWVIAGTPGAERPMEAFLPPDFTM
ncbi:hypothetical protein [Qipengyuania qiaonensis]|uniref:DUF2306 domain-containing protein n=1 Tax=Qipengyuania qiaonensis TaxID=2867240 RepID=A0ABS7JDE5_9SPHN|nr:hypothetical protein [Qipengyuania qiaonensis]MBX7483854.1 hypothetical protein [Qipengyuania qiaonensis]